MLLLEPSGQVLWESTCALENSITRSGDNPGWGEWIDELTSRQAANSFYFDPAFAEISAAKRLDRPGDVLTTFLYATPVAVEQEANAITGLIVATKSGFRRLHANRLIDASEAGLLAILSNPGVASLRRQPARAHHSLTLYSREWERFESAVKTFCEDDGSTLLSSLRATERRLVWPNDGSPWHRQVAALLRRFRDAIPSGTDIVVGQCPSQVFPGYEGSLSAPLPDLPTNLSILSPTLRSEPIRTLEDRFSLGARVGGQVDRDDPRAEGPAISSPISLPEPSRQIETTVTIAGAGTSGALAALAASQQNVQVTTLDFAPFPGGVGTGAGISGYFHGLEGGLQVEIDQLTAEMNVLLEGKNFSARRWHHDGKKIALLLAFEQHGVKFLGRTMMCGVEKSEEGTLTAVLAATDEGLIRVKSRTFIDSTGDGDLCALGDADFRSGRSGDGRMLAYSQPALTLKFSDQDPSVTTCNFDAGWIDPTDPEDLSQARLSGVAHYWSEKWSTDIPLAVAPLLGIRQSRHIVTDYCLSFADLVQHQKFSDSIGEAGSIADTHSVDFEFEDDEAVFFYWACRLFRYPLRYRTSLPHDASKRFAECLDRLSGFGRRSDRFLRCPDATRHAATW